MKSYSSINFYVVKSGKKPKMKDEPSLTLTGDFGQASGHEFCNRSIIKEEAVLSMD